MNRRSIQAAALTAVAVLVLSTTLVVASPGEGINPPSTRGDGVISGGTNVNTPHVVQLRSYGDLRVFDQEVTIGPLGHTGWHRHPGPVLVTVVTGTFRYQLADCSYIDYGPGQTVVDTGRVVHRGVNPSTTSSASLSITYLTPVGAPLRIEADAVTC
jgi:quercetin dioxygenase-like cupin family protein